MKKILERVISLIKDTSVQVSDSAKEVAIGLKGICYDFPTVFSRLSSVYQQIFQEYCEQIRGSTVLRNNFQRISDSSGKSILEGLEKPRSFAFQSTSLSSIAAGISGVYLESNNKNLVFGFIPTTLMQQLEDQENWRLRVNAVQELENIVMSMENFNDVMPYMAVLIRFLNKLLEDNNFKVSISTLNIIKEVICIQGAAQQSNITQILPICIKKLGDNKIAVRQCAFKVFLSLFRNSKSRNITSVIIPQLCEALSDSNWHIREEVVIILLASMLDSIEYDYFLLIPDLAKLLDDTKTKIRYVATEALAFIAKKDQSEVISKLRPIVDDNAMNALMQRFQYKATPVLTEDYVEFPKTFPNSAPAISSPYITATPFIRTDSTSLGRTIDLMTPNPLNSSFTPQTVNKFKRLRPTSESTITSTEETIIKPSKQIFSNRNDKSKLNYQARYILKQNQEKNPQISINPPKEEQIYKSFQSSPTISKLKPEPNQNEDQPIYLAVEELKKVSNPEEALQKCIVAGSLENWNDQFEALNMLRRLLKHHPEVFLSQVTLHNICIDLIKWADSLRSSLSKNGLIVIGEMCENLGRTLDSEIHELLKVLIKKSIDTNIFISEQAEVAIESMCRYSSENKLISSLLSVAQTNKNPLSRAKIAGCYAVIFRRMKFAIGKARDIDKILVILSEYLADATFDVRNNSKEAIIAFSECFQSEIDLERILSRCLNDSSKKKFLEALQNKLLNRTSSPIKDSAQKEFRSSKIVQKNSRNSRTRSIGFSQDIPELESISKISSDMLSPEWKVRYNSIGSLQDLVTEYTEILKTSPKLLSAIDIFCKGLSDQNLKVHIHTLNSLIKVIPSLGKAIEPHLSLVINSLLPGLGSANSSIREIARDVASCILQYCEPLAIIVPLSSAVINTNARSRATIVSMITELTPKVYEKKSNIIIKNVIPVLIKLIDDSKIDVREEKFRLTNKLYQIMSSQLFEYIPAGKTQKIIEILNDGIW